MQRKSIEIWVGLFVLAGIAALLMLALKVGNLNSAGGSGGFTITARFDNIGGLTVKAPVSLAGVRIGRVTDIRVARDDYRAEVEMQISSEYDNLPEDTSASILTAGLLGAQYIGLEPGGEEIFLQNGDQIYLTQSAVVLEQLIGQMLFSKAAGEE